MPKTYINPTTLEFLRELAVNNNREWFAVHKKRHDEAKVDLKIFGNALMEEMNKTDHIDNVKLFRIYRDVRFSKNKLPYKTSKSGHLTRATKLLRGGYYFHFEPDNCFLAGGFWDPNKEDLARVRKELDFDGDSLRKIINTKEFKKHFGELEGNQLKTAPRGYPKDHENVDLLRYKQFILTKQFTDKEATTEGFVSKLVEGYQAMRPFLDYMSDVLTTDENGVSIV